MAKNIVLIGFMGAGKSLIATELHKRLGWPKFSTDELIEAREKTTISEVFKNKGEPYFRQVESAVVKELSSKKKSVIDCGGGIVLNPHNIELLKKNGTLFFLLADPKTLYERVKNEKHRPLLEASDPLKKIEEIYYDRLPLYKHAADVVLDANDKSIQGPVQEIMKVVLQ